MPTLAYEGNIARAARALRRQEMTEHSHHLDWLADPALVPDFALGGTDILGLPQDPFDTFVVWALGTFAANAETKANELDYTSVFERYKLGPDERCITRQLQQKFAYKSYSPGLDFMSKILKAVPSVAAGAGDMDIASWTETAAQARHFGRKVAIDGTIVQFLVRSYLGSPSDLMPLNPDLLKLDGDTGITTVTPIDELVTAANSANERFNPRRGDHSGVCAAMQTRAADLQEDVSMYDAAWMAFTAVAGERIFPAMEPVPAQQKEPDPLFQIQMDVMAMRQLLGEVPSGDYSVVFAEDSHDYGL